MSDIAIQIDKLSKRYRLGTIGGKRLVDDLNRWWARVRGQEDPLSKVGSPSAQPPPGGADDPEAQILWALRDVSFEVKKGEVLGIIGRNGAGKSTLLKILSRVTAPTFGEVRIRGRIASLLEVGTGFNPELTGRENIFLNGAILGMRKAEIRAKFDEIVAFSEVGKFIDTPVKRYSSGMYVRLAFAVAAHLDPEILIVDEVLAVGDAAFQDKCLGKMKEASKKEGRTVLFVSHNIEAVLALTTSSVLMAQGQVLSAGPTREVVSMYLNRGARGQIDYRAPANGRDPTITHVRLETTSPKNVQAHGEPMLIEVAVNIPKEINRGRFEIYAHNEKLERVFLVWAYDSPEQGVFRTPGDHVMRCRIPKLHLYAGKYTLSVFVAERYGGKTFEKLEGVCPFEVVMNSTRDGGWSPGEGSYLEDAEWQILPPVAGGNG